MKKSFFILSLMVSIVLNAKADEYYYDDNGRQIKIVYDDYVNEYIYDDNGHMIQRKTYDLDRNLIDSVDVNLTFDENGHITSRRYSNGKYYLYTYNDDGTKNTVEYYNSDNSLNYKNIYEYDENNKEIGYKQYNKNDSLTGTYTYEFDEYGNKIATYKDSVLLNNHHPSENTLKKQAHEKWLKNRKLIYTVEEARQAVDAAGTDTVNFRIRYK